MIAHIGPVPVVEVLPSIAGAGTGLLLVRAWIMLRVPKRREPG